MSSLEQLLLIEHYVRKEKFNLSSKTCWNDTINLHLAKSISWNQVVASSCRCRASSHACFDQWSVWKMYHHWHEFPVSFSLSPETPCQLEYRHFVCFFSAFFSMLLCIIGSLVNWAYEEMSPLSRSWICEPLQMVKSQILLLVLVTSHLQLHDPIYLCKVFHYYFES